MPTPNEPPAGADDIPCPHCGQLNERQREVCWACGKLLSAKPAPVAGGGGVRQRAGAPDSGAWSARFPGEPAESSNIQVAEDGGALRLTRVWYSPAAACFLLALVALGFYFWWTFLSHAGMGRTGRRDYSELYFLGPMGAWFCYLALASLLNRTVVRVDAARLTVRVGPLPWSWPVELPTTDIAELGLEQHWSYSKGANGWRYGVKAVRKDGKEKILFTGNLRGDFARLVIDRVNARLRVKDRRAS